MERKELWMTVEKVVEETGLTAHAVRHMAERGTIIAAGAWCSTGASWPKP